MSTAISFYLSATGTPISYTAGPLPDGLAFNTSTGLISGTSTTAGIYRVNVSLTNAGGTSTAVWSLLVKDGSSFVPQFTTGAAEVVATLGRPFGFQAYVSIYDDGISVSALCTFTITGVPPGMAATSYPSDLYLYGTPTVAGIYPMTITATGPGGGSTSQTVVLLVADPSVPTITTPATLSGNVNVAFSYSVTANSGAVINSYSAGSLPDGLVFNTKTGAITGVPTTAGTFPVGVSASNASGTVRATLSLTVEDSPTAPAVASAAGISASIGVPFGFQFYGSNIPGMPAATGYAVDTIPAGLSLNGATGAISGVATGPEGTYPVAVTAFVGTVATAHSVLTVTILSAPATLPPPVMTSPAGAFSLVGIHSSTQSRAPPSRLRPLCQPE